MPQIRTEDIKNFFEKYGTVIELSVPNRSDEQYHANILFFKKEEAEMAIANAKRDEKALERRLSNLEISVQTYEGNETT